MMKSFVIAIAFSATIGLHIGTATAQQGQNIGNAVAITNAVLGTDGAELREISIGDDIFQNQVIETGSGAVAEFKLADQTQLALGENTKLTLDEVVYDPQNSDGNQMVITALVGAMRFVSGDTTKENVLIKTPTTTIGIRGTAFDIHVNEQGETAIALLEGEVVVCNLQNACRTLRRIGYLIWVNALGVVTEPVQWTADLIQDVTFATAFPFIAKTANVTTPIKFAKASAETFGATVSTTGKVVKKAGKSAKKATDVPKNAARAVGKSIKKGTKRLKKLFK